MKFRFFLRPSSARIPRLAWLEVTEITLRIAYDLFAWSKKFGAFGILDWAAMSLLRLASRALGRAPVECLRELQANLPARI